MEKVDKKPTKKKARRLPVVGGGFGAGQKFEHWIDPVKGWKGDIGGKVGLRRSAHTRWKKDRAIGMTKRRRG